MTGISFGLASIGNDALKRVNHCMSYVDNQGAGFCLGGGVTMAGGRVRSVRAAEPLLRTRGMLVSCSVFQVYMVRHPRGSYIVTPLLSLEVTTQDNKSIHPTLSSICKEIRRTSDS